VSENVGRRWWIREEYRGKGRRVMSNVIDFMQRLEKAKTIQEFRELNLLIDRAEMTEEDRLKVLEMFSRTILLLELGLMVMKAGYAPKDFLKDPNMVTP